MTDKRLKHLLGLAFEKDDVSANWHLLACMLGYDAVSATEVVGILVDSDDDLPMDFEVREGKYNSAVMVEYIVCGGVLFVGRLPGQIVGLTVADWNRGVIRQFVEAFMGERICAEARADKGKHPLLGTLLPLLDGEMPFFLTVVYELAE